MTKNQLLIWLGQESARGEPIFNELSVFVIPGELRPDVFHEAFRRTVAQTDALRTVVRGTSLHPTIEVLESVTYASPVFDLSSSTDVDGALDEWAKGEVDATIDLTTRSFRSTLLTLGPDRFAWALLCHQMLTDATSMSLVFDRVGAWYHRLAGGVEHDPPEVPPFQEYVRRDREAVDSPRHHSRATYWDAKLSDLPDPQVYYGGKSAPRGISRRVRVDRALGRDLTAAIRELAGRDGVRTLSEHLSTYSIFSATLATLLHKLSGHQRVMVGSTWHNRPRAFDATVGLFMVQNPFEVRVGPDDTFRALIGSVQSEALASMRHLPYAAGNPGGRAYDVTLNYVKVAIGPFAGRRVDHRWYRPSVGDGSLQLQVHDIDGRDQLTVSFDLSTDVFDERERSALIDHYLQCLRTLVSDVDAIVDSTSMLTETERATLAGWNDTKQEYPRDCTVVDLVERQAKRTPDAVAVVGDGESVTYRQLCDRASAIAWRLRAAGVLPGARVGIYLDRSVDLVVGVLGVLAAGGAYVPLDPTYPRERLEYMTADSGARVILTESAQVELAVDGERTVVLVNEVEPRDGGDEPTAADGSTAGLRPSSDDLAYVLYTSGSTGRPKGVEIPHRALTNFLTSMAREPGCGPDDTLLAVTTLSFDIAGLELFLPLVVGARVEIATREIAADGRLLRERLDSGTISVLQATPATWRMLLDSGWTGTPGLKALVGGESLATDLMAPLLRRTASLWNMYGPTETTIWSSVRRISSPNEEITIGRPIANTGFHVVDTHLHAVPIGIAGELLISGDGLARGYHDRPDLTAASFVQVPSGHGSVRMYRTGDLVRLRADGEAVHLGRIDSQVKLRGFRIELGEIEGALATHPFVHQAVAAVHGASTAAARLVAYVVPTRGFTVDAVDLKRHLRPLLPGYMVPQQFVVVERLPLTPNGKVDRRRLPDVEPVSGGFDDEKSPMSPVQARVAASFRHVLGVTSVGLDDDFFELGGQSILALRLVSRLSDELEVDVPLQVLFEASTVRALSGRLAVMTATTPELRAVLIDRADLEQRLDRVWRSELARDVEPDSAPARPLTDEEVDQLLGRVRREFGVAAEGLSALDFRSDPSVPGLARMLRDALHPPQALVVPLQPEGDLTPLFLIHAGGGYVFFYRALAARLGPRRPVYAVRAATRRDDGQHRFDRVGSVGELASQYIEEIKAIQPHGPYSIGGACFGGVVAFEMAQQLTARGESIEGPILLFDAYIGKIQEDWSGYASRTRAKLAERLDADPDASHARLIRLLLASSVTRPRHVLGLVPVAVRSVARRVTAVLRETRAQDLLRATRTRRVSPVTEQEQLETMREFVSASLRLISRYDPDVYPGSALLIKAKSALDPEPLWRPWITGELQIHVAPGEHLEMMEEPWVRQTAEVVRAALACERPSESSVAEVH